MKILLFPLDITQSVKRLNKYYKEILEKYNVEIKDYAYDKDTIYLEVCGNLENFQQSDDFNILNAKLVEN